MPNYARYYEPEATYFFTLVTHERKGFLTSWTARHCLRAAWRETCEHRPFQTVAVCLLPDHLHCLWTLPAGDTDYATRWSAIKSRFTRYYQANGGTEGTRNASRQRRGERGFWQRRFWEHVIRDAEDFARHFDYIHFNPVKHGLVDYPEQWPWSTFHRYARQGWYNADWGNSEPARIRGVDLE